MSQQYTVYLGCMIPMRFAGIDYSARFVFEKLGAGLVDLEGYTCCPDPVLTRMAEDEFSYVLAARNLALAERTGNDLVVLCNGCFETLIEAQELLAEDADLLATAKSHLAKEGLEYSGTLNIRAFIDVLAEDFTAEELGAPVVASRPLKIASHTGCHMLRADVHPRERVKLLDDIVRASKFEPVPYGRELDCCGFPMSTANEKAALLERVAPKIQAMTDAGADLMVTGCPTCLHQLESGQLGLKKLGVQLALPVYHILEIMALAYGADPDKMGLELHRGEAKKFAVANWGVEDCQ